MSNSLGKRKERDEKVQDTEQNPHGYVIRFSSFRMKCDERIRSTLFVSNLPYSATSTDLKTLFSDIGPVKTAFVVLEHGTETSKGVGYVSFAIREDAQLAFDKVNEAGEGITLDDRRLRVQWASNKVSYNQNLLLNKPVSYVCSRTKMRGRPAKALSKRRPNLQRSPGLGSRLDRAIRTLFAL